MIREDRGEWRVAARPAAQFRNSKGAGCPLGDPRQEPS
jgi:hypothetical protein